MILNQGSLVQQSGPIKGVRLHVCSRLFKVVACLKTPHEPAIRGEGAATKGAAFFFLKKPSKI